MGLRGRAAAVVFVLAVALAAAAAFAGEAARDENCVGEVRLRGPIWDGTTNRLEAGLPEILDEVARTIREHCVGKLIVIESHAYSLPSSELNEKLAELRGAVVRYELVQRGITATELAVVAIGDGRPLFPLDGPDAIKRNRRIAFRAAD